MTAEVAFLPPGVKIKVNGPHRGLEQSDEHHGRPAASSEAGRLGVSDGEGGQPWHAHVRGTMSSAFAAWLAHLLVKSPGASASAGLFGGTRRHPNSDGQTPRLVLGRRLDVSSGDQSCRLGPRTVRDEPFSRRRRPNLRHVLRGSREQPELRPRSCVCVGPRSVRGQSSGGRGSRSRLGETAAHETAGGIAVSRWLLMGRGSTSPGWFDKAGGFTSLRAIRSQS